MSQRQSVRAIIIKGQSLLVVKRNKFGREYYTLPGGVVDMGEEAEQALRRELQEEVSLQVGAVRPVFMEDGGLLYGLQYIYLCEYQGGEPVISAGSEEDMLNKLGQNLHELLWLPLAELPNVSFRSSSVRDAIVGATRSGFPETPVTLAWRAESVTK